MQALIAAAVHRLRSCSWILLTGEAEGAMTLDQLRAEGRKALDEDARRRSRKSALKFARKIPPFSISPPAPLVNRKWAW